MALILKTTLWLLLSTPSSAQPLDQDAHMRFVASYDGYHRVALDVRTIKSMDRVQFSVCKDETCENFPEFVSFEKINSFKEPLLTSLREYRKELEAQKSGFFSVVSGDKGKKKDLAALDNIISDIEKDGLQSWVLLTKQNIQKDPVAFGTYEGAEGFYDILQSTLLGTKPPAAEIKQMERVNQKLRAPSQLLCK